MAEDLLLELETAPPVAGTLEHVEELEREALRYAVQVGLAVEGMRGSAALFENAWRRMVIEVASGQTQEIQCLRPRVVGAFEKRLSQLKHTHAVAAWLRELGSENVPSPDVLLREIAGMGQLKTGVLDRWQTAEDLEDLAARDYPLTMADLDQIGPQHRPAAAYYAQDSKPF